MDGASVNDAGSVRGRDFPKPPLVTAVSNKRYDIVLWLLSHGANTNGVLEMENVLAVVSSDIMQVLIDVGGDVNQHGVWPPLLKAIVLSLEAHAWVLLAQRYLDLDGTKRGITADRIARGQDMPALADAIVEEVSGGRREVEFVSFASRCVPSKARTRCCGCAEGKTSDAGTSSCAQLCTWCAMMRATPCGTVTFVLWQSAEQRAVDVEAADAASVSRLVRDCCHVLVRWWRVCVSMLLML